MKLKGKNVSIHDTLKEHNLKGDCIMGDFLNADFNILKISSEEVHKNVPKLYAYDVRGKNNETEAIIAFKIISMLNVRCLMNISLQAFILFLIMRHH